MYEHAPYSFFDWYSTIIHLAITNSSIRYFIKYAYMLKPPQYIIHTEQYNMV